MDKIYEVWQRHSHGGYCKECEEDRLVATFSEHDKFLVEAYENHPSHNYYVIEKKRFVKEKSSKNSFFRCFSYDHTFNGGGDKTINFELVVVTRDIPELGLVKGAEYECVWWQVNKCYFHFINWKKEHGSEEDWEKNHCGSLIPDPQKSLKVNQVELGPYLVWWDEDLPKNNKFNG